MNDIYDLVRRADGKAVYSFPVGGRYLVDTSNGIQSMRPLMEDEIIDALLRVKLLSGYC